MTTVAFDGKTIACDSMLTVSSGEVSYKLHTNKFRLYSTSSTKILSILVGDIRGLTDNEDRISRGEPPVFPKRKSADRYDSTIITVQDGVVTLYSSHRDVPEVITTVDALGSGEHIARTVLLLGGSAGQAVAASIAIDTFSGGAVHEWDVNTLAYTKNGAKVPWIVR